MSEPKTYWLYQRHPYGDLHVSEDKLESAAIVVVDKKAFDALRADAERIHQMALDFLDTLHGEYCAGIIDRCVDCQREMNILKAFKKKWSKDNE